MRKLLTLDFETYFTRAYNLRRLSIEEYVRNQQFRVHCLAVKPYREPAECVPAEKAEEWVKAQDWENTSVICHHAAFDCFILSHIYHVSPRMIFCTLSMARALNGPLVSCSLEALAAQCGLGAKTVPYNDVCGLSWESMPGALRRALMDGCMHDAALTENLFDRFIQHVPPAELSVIDLTVRMFTEPQIIGNAGELHALAETERLHKDELMQALGVAEADLQSASKFTALLEALGEDVPRKQGKSGLIPCVAKTDDYMQGLLERQDSAGRLAEARLAVRSTINETRAGRLAGIAERGRVPVYLHYCRAVTTRWSGGGSVNMQNLPRSGALRRALKAPEGHAFIILDFKQIEYRVLCGLTKMRDKLEALNDPARDLYCEFATKLFQRPITRGNEKERMFGKVIVLSSGYGSGHGKAAALAKSYGFENYRQLGEIAIDMYRREHGAVVRLWQTLDRVLRSMHRKEGFFALGPVCIEGSTVMLPNMLIIDFDLLISSDGSLLRRARKGGPVQDNISIIAAMSEGYERYWGGTLTNFLCQSIARCYLSDLMVEASSQLGLRPCMLAHDEYVTIVDADAAPEYERWLISLASTPRPWWPDGPVMDVETHIAGAYEK